LLPLQPVFGPCIQLCKKREQQSVDALMTN
jgi:hypothetical protein